MKVIEYLRGITPEECEALRGFGIVHTIDLVHGTEYRYDRTRLAEKSGIPEPRLLALAQQAGLIEVSGLDERYLQVLRRLGITSLRDLAGQDAAELHGRCVRALGLAGSPSLGQVQYWVSQARVIDIFELEEAPVAELPPELLGESLEATRAEI